MSGLSKFLKLLPELIFPKNCIACGSEGSELCFYCNDLWLESPGQKGKNIFSFKYANPQIRGLLRNWKYHFSKEAHQKIREELLSQEEFLKLAFEFRNIDCIVPVPLHWQRFNERGFDQALELASILSDIVDIPVLNILKRNKSTKQQARKARSERSKIDPSLFKVTGEVRGRNICLVDDVWTTGATMKSAARALKSAGAEDVTYYTLCRGK